MFPQHLQTIILSVILLVMAGPAYWPVAQLAPAIQAAPELDLPPEVVPAGPVPTSVVTPTILSGLALGTGPAFPTLWVPLGYRNSPPPANAGPGPAEIQTAGVAPVAGRTVEEFSPTSVSYFTEIGFGVEYGDSPPVLHKWTEDVRIRVNGTPTRVDLDVLDKVVPELNELIPDVELWLTDADANLEVYFLAESQFSLVEPGYVPVNLGFFRVWWDDTGAIYRARVLVSSQGITQQERSHLIREELTQSLGLFRDSWRYPDSMFYQGWTDITRYSDLDRSIIRLLYDPHLEPGMTQNEAREALGVDPADMCCRD